MASQGNGGRPAARLGSFEEFWPYYVGEHRDPWTRRLHFVGTTAAGLCLARAIAARRPALALGALVAGYGPAWVSHFFVEKNRPATFTYPLWSLLADFKMWSLIARGAMDAEVERVTAAGDARASGERDGADAVASGERERERANGSAEAEPPHTPGGVLN